MSTPDFFRARLDGMVDPRHPLVELVSRLPWDRIEAALAPKFALRERPAQAERMRICSASNPRALAASAMPGARACRSA